MDIETECKRAAGEQCGSENSEDAGRLPVNGPQNQHAAGGQGRTGWYFSFIAIEFLCTLQPQYGRVIVGICAVNDLLSGRPIFDEIPVSGALVTQAEEKDTDHQAKTGNDDARSSNNAQGTGFPRSFYFAFQTTCQCTPPSAKVHSDRFMASSSIFTGARGSEEAPCPRPCQSGGNYRLLQQTCW